MLLTGTIASRLYDELQHKSVDIGVEDIRIGLGYVGVKLGSKRLGLAAVLRHELSPGCTTINKAGTLRGRTASELLTYLVAGRNPLDKAIGLATANALTEHNDTLGEDTISLLHLTDRDHVVMVGLFGPLVQKIRSTGAELSIIERDPARMKIADEQEKKYMLQKCSVAIITATTLMTDTLEEILNSMGEPRRVVLLGPSTPLCSNVFEDTIVTHLGGSSVIDSDKILQIISEGGGTPAMRSYLKFVTIPTANRKEKQ